MFIFCSGILCFILINIWYKSNSRFYKAQWSKFNIIFQRKKFKHELMQTLIGFINVSQKYKFHRNETFTKKMCYSKRVYFKSDCWKKINFFEGFMLHKKLFVFRRCFEGKTMTGWLKIQKQPSIGALIKRF